MKEAQRLPADFDGIIAGVALAVHVGQALQKDEAAHASSAPVHVMPDAGTAASFACKAP